MFEGVAIVPASYKAKFPMRQSIKITNLIDSQPHTIVAVNDRHIETLDRKERYQILYGGSGAGKSHIKALDLLIKALTKPYFKCIFGRKFSAQIRKSQFALLTDIIEKRNWQQYFHYSKAENSSMIITCLLNGNSLTPMGLDDVHKWTSVHGYTDVWIEEPLSKGKQSGSVTLKDFEEVDRRLRNSPDDNYTQHIHLTFNPISVNSWIYGEFFSEKASEYKAQSYTHKSTFRDNYFIDRKAEEEKLRRQGEYEFAIYGNGEWGLVRADSPFFYEFDMDKHVAKLEYELNQKFIFVLDFNIDIMATSVWKIDRREKYAYCVYEFPPCKDIDDRCESIATSPFGRILDMCEFTGDATGNARSGLRKGETYWSVIKKKLGMRVSQLKVPPSNIDHVTSRQLCNYVMRNFDFCIDESCENMKADLMTCETSDEGKIDKAKYDPHYGDGFRYLCQNYLSNII